MTASHTTKGTRRYRYYVCAGARQRGWQTCPAPALPAGPIEQLVVEQIQRLDPAAAGEDFASVWEGLPPPEQARVAHRLVERLDYDGAQGKVTITFHAEGSAVLAPERAREQPKEPSP
jgi:hypothetical protein